jgi:hypothetical protein
MTAVLTVTCDRCGSTITTDRTLLCAESGPGRHRLPDGLDLCPACFDRLLTSLASGQAAESGGSIR